MKTLFINACVRSGSRTLPLAQSVLGHLGGEITEIRLAQETIRPLTEAALTQREACIQKGDYSDPIFRYGRQFADADTIVLAAPFWDLSFPSIVKVYLETVMVLGLTFSYTPEGLPRGLCRADRLFYVTTSGGPTAGLNLGYDYVSALARTFLGIPETVCFQAQNLDIVGSDADALLRQARAQIDAYFADYEKK